MERGPPLPWTTHPYSDRRILICFYILHSLSENSFTTFRSQGLDLHLTMGPATCRTLDSNHCGRKFLKERSLLNICRWKWFYTCKISKTYMENDLQSWNISLKSNWDNEAGIIRCCQQTMDIRGRYCLKPWFPIVFIWWKELRNHMGAWSYQEE